MWEEQGADFDSLFQASFLDFQLPLANVRTYREVKSCLRLVLLFVTRVLSRFLRLPLCVQNHMTWSCVLGMSMLSDSRNRVGASMAFGGLYTFRSGFQSTRLPQFFDVQMGTS